MRTGLATLSLDQPTGDRQENYLGRLVPDYREDDPLQNANRDLLRTRMREVLQKLNYRERTIIRLRFGFVDGQVHSLQELGKMFGVSKERIRQVETAALEKLKLPKVANKLVGFLEMPMQGESRN
jgi:RNA polymerase primary sigma factor